MDGLFAVILFLVFILIPLIEQIRKQGKTPPPPRRPVPRQRPPLPRSQSEEVSGKPREPAATMIPDELWKILTGEERQPAEPPTARPQPKPRDVYVPPPESEGRETPQLEDVNVEVARTTPEAIRREHARRHKPGQAVSLEVQPTVVSLEVEPPPAATRHRRFHEKLEAEAAPATRAQKPRYRFGSRSELQRVFVLQEVFGRPRGLE